MYRLGSDALTSMFEKCSNNPNYKTAIMMDDRDRQKEFMLAMKESDNTHNWSINVRNGTIKFKNGSEIVAVPFNGKQNVRGRKFHEIFFDGEFEEAAIQYLFTPMLMPYDRYGEVEDGKVDDTALDNFLDEFKVTQ